MSKTEQKDLSWIEEAWQYSRMAEDDLPTIIEEYYGYQSKKNVQMHQADSPNARQIKTYSDNGKIS
jgi:hypothetical protein